MFSAREYSQESEAETLAREERKRTTDQMDVSEVNQIPLPSLKKQKVRPPKKKSDKVKFQ